MGVGLYEELVKWLINWYTLNYNYYEKGKAKEENPFFFFNSMCRASAGSRVDYGNTTTAATTTTTATTVLLP